MSVDASNIRTSGHEPKEAESEYGISKAVREAPTTPAGIYSALVKGFLPLADEMIDLSNGARKEFTSSNNFAIKEGWAFLKEALKDVSMMNMPDLSDKTISEKVDAVMFAVFSGEITDVQGKRLIEMLQAGFEITELKELIAKLSEAGVELE